MPPFYTAAPITEAIIEYRFATALDRVILEKAAKRLVDLFPFQTEENIFEVEFSGQQPAVSGKPFGFRITSSDQAEILQIRPSQIAFSILAPYPGWDVFEEKFFGIWDALRRLRNSSDFARIGLRYVNRIDVPMAMVSPNEYVRMFPETPEGFPEPTVLQAGHIQTKDADVGVDIILNVATVPPPLVGHSSLQLDIDIARTTSFPAQLAKQRALLRDMRTVKNRMFELLVTDKARKLFGS